MAALLDEGKPATTLLTGDCREMLASLPAGIVQTCVTSPPYWGLRDYGTEGQLGAEDSPAEYVDNLVQVFAAVRRVLRDDGTLWLNLGDCYCSTDKWGGGGPNTGKQTVSDDGDVPSWAVRRKKAPIPGIRPKNLIGIPWRVAFALQTDGWYLRSDIIWEKPNAMPESVRDRPTRAHEYIFLLTKSPKYYYDADAIKEPLKCEADATLRAGERARAGHKSGSIGGAALGRKSFTNPLAGRNKRTVWSVATRPYHGAHFAVFPPALIEPCILAGSRPGDTVLDPFLGSGTSGAVAAKHGRQFIGIDNNPSYVEMARQRILTVQ